ncbi:hypothetical protein TGCAST_221430 [Toxoplasma gondii CAST]|uniref:Uncharacterized protein n=1 Tax=Toxoplasma gondii CAST TaxID=943122 RepID=A0A3R8GFJ6_TOXGO|nr:hypothetical protein TGCAST_221430 [Toxoplasma gondii CAST]
MRGSLLSPSPSFSPLTASSPRFPLRWPSSRKPLRGSSCLRSEPLSDLSSSSSPSRVSVLVSLPSSPLPSRDVSVTRFRKVPHLLLRCSLCSRPGTFLARPTFSLVTPASRSSSTSAYYLPLSPSSSFRTCSQSPDSCISSLCEWAPPSPSPPSSSPSSAFSVSPSSSFSVTPLSSFSVTPSCLLGSRKADGGQRELKRPGMFTLSVCSDACVGLSFKHFRVLHEKTANAFPSLELKLALCVDEAVGSSPGVRTPEKCPFQDKSLTPRESLHAVRVESRRTLSTRAPLSPENKKHAFSVGALSGGFPVSSLTACPPLRSFSSSSQGSLGGRELESSACLEEAASAAPAGVRIAQGENLHEFEYIDEQEREDASKRCESNEAFNSSKRLTCRQLSRPKGNLSLRSDEEPPGVCTPERPEADRQKMRRFSLRKHRGGALLTAWKSVHSALRIQDFVEREGEDLFSSRGNRGVAFDGTPDLASSVRRRALPPLPLHAKNMRRYPTTSLSAREELRADSETHSAVQGLLAPSPGNLTLVRLECAEKKLRRKGQETLTRLLREGIWAERTTEARESKSEYREEEKREDETETESVEENKREEGAAKTIERISVREDEGRRGEEIRFETAESVEDRGMLEADELSASCESSVRTEELRSYLRYVICTLHHLELETLFSLFCRKNLESFSAKQLHELHFLLFFEDPTERGEKKGRAPREFAEASESAESLAAPKETVCLGEGPRDPPDSEVEERNGTDKTKPERKAASKQGRNAFLLSLLNGTAKEVPQSLRENQVLALLLHYLHTEHPLLPQMTLLRRAEGKSSLSQASNISEKISSRSHLW